MFYVQVFPLARKSPRKKKEIHPQSQICVNEKMLIILALPQPKSIVDSVRLGVIDLLAEYFLCTRKTRDSGESSTKGVTVHAIQTLHPAMDIEL